MIMVLHLKNPYYLYLMSTIYLDQTCLYLGFHIYFHSFMLDIFARCAKEKLSQEIILQIHLIIDFVLLFPAYFRHNLLKKICLDFNNIILKYIIVLPPYLNTFKLGGICYYLLSFVEEYNSFFYFESTEVLLELCVESPSL